MGLLKMLEEDAWVKLSLSQNPFFMDDRSKSFSELITILRDYSSLSTNNLFWEFESYAKRKTAYNELKQKKKKINQILISLIPKGATNKKGNPRTRQLRIVPGPFIYYIEIKKELLKKEVKRYKQKYKYMDKPELIEIIYKEQSDIKNPSNINIDYRSYTTIVISICAYYMKVSFDTLYRIYHSVDKQKRKDIVSNPNKYA